MFQLSKKLKPVYLWLSLHDTTPNVIAQKRAVYCHNSFPYYKWKAREWVFAPKIVLFALFTNFIYRINIRKNKYIVVQQEWMKKNFIRAFGLQREMIIVAPPPLAFPVDNDLSNSEKMTNRRAIETSPYPLQRGIGVHCPPLEGVGGGRECDSSSATKFAMTQNSNMPAPENYSFFFPSAADSHKNFECICQAAKIVTEKMGIDNFSVSITVKGDENKYAKWLYKKWGKGIPNIEFAGYLDKKTLYAFYHQTNCLIFPSKIETWGLPITEFAAFQKPMLLADMPYAHESASGCNKVAFFNPDDPTELAEKMQLLIQGDECFLTALEKNNIPAPVAWSWQELFDILLTREYFRLVNFTPKGAA
jgi:glycosyltransferase involved in cell wall biosynthesis